MTILCTPKSAPWVVARTRLQRGRLRPCRADAYLRPRVRVMRSGVGSCLRIQPPIKSLRSSYKGLYPQRLEGGVWGLGFTWCGGRDLLRSSVSDKYSGSMKITTHLHHISRCKRASDTNWSSRWTYRVFIINTRRDSIWNSTARKRLNYLQGRERHFPAIRIDFVRSLFMLVFGTRPLPAPHEPR